MIATLLKVLTHDRASVVRGHAAVALGKLGQGSAEVIAALLNALNDNRNASGALVPITQLGLPNFSSQSVSSDRSRRFST